MRLSLRLRLALAALALIVARSDRGLFASRDGAAASGLAKVLFADGPDTKLADKLDLFGQFVGNWEVAIVNHLPGATTQRLKGEWHFGWILNGRAVQDVWMAPQRADRDRGGALVGYGTTLRYYDTKRAAWRILWASVTSHSFIVFTASRVGDEIVMDAENAKPAARWIFSDLTRQSFHWRAVQSNDGWRTSELQQEMTATRLDSRDSLRASLIARGCAPGLEAENQLFGQLAGDWTIAHEGIRPDGTITETEGTLNLGWILDGRAVQDVWRFRNPATGEFVAGTTVRLFDPAISAWHSIWFFPVANIIQPFTARLRRDEIVLEGSTPAGLPEQWIFSKLTPSSFDWRAIESNDERATWRLTEHMRIRRAESQPTSVSR